LYNSPLLSKHPSSVTFNIVLIFTFLVLQRGLAMEPVRFADILFTALTLIITCGILYLVKRAKDKSSK
jgi:hypothetical protein